MKEDTSKLIVELIWQGYALTFEPFHEWGIMVTVSKSPDGLIWPERSTIMTKLLEDAVTYDALAFVILKTKDELDKAMTKPLGVIEGQSGMACGGKNEAI